MDKVIHCHCGFEARAEHEDALVAEVRRHALETHGMALSHDEALLLLFRAELDRDRAVAQPVGESRLRASHVVMHDLKEEK